MDGIVARTVMLYDPDRFTKFVRFVTKVGLFHFTISRFGNISQNILGERGWAYRFLLPFFFALFNRSSLFCAAFLQTKFFLAFDRTSPVERTWVIEEGNGNKSFHRYTQAWSVASFNKKKPSIFAWNVFIVSLLFFLRQSQKKLDENPLQSTVKDSARTEPRS